MILKYVAMTWQFLKKWWQSQFGSQEFFQLVLQQKYVELSDQDEERINNWVEKDGLRKLAYQNFAILLKYKRRVEDWEKYDIRIILQDLRKVFPKIFSRITDNLPNGTLRDMLTNYLDQGMYNMANIVVFGNKWLTVFILLAKIFLSVLCILIMVLMVKG